MSPTTTSSSLNSERSANPIPANVSPFVRRVRIRNYKSIGHCDVELGPLTVLVGRNGSGKSNVLDALRFVVDALKGSLDQAIKSRGGIGEVCRRSMGHPHDLAVELTLDLSESRTAIFGFEIAARSKSGFVVKHEFLSIIKSNSNIFASYEVEQGNLNDSTGIFDNGKAMVMPPVSADRLYLVNASGLPQFREVYDNLLAMGFYNWNLEVLRELQDPDPGEILQRDGANIASVIHRISVEEPKTKKRLQSYLSSIVPNVKDVNRVSIGPKETLQFHQSVSGAASPWKFYAESMSDGALRALGTLVAVMQVSAKAEFAKFVGIEEPETALHPAASAALMDAFREAAHRTQILITSHSPDLLDQVRLETDQMLVVQARDEITEIAPIDHASRHAIKESLYSAGQLLSMNQLEPDPSDLSRQSRTQLKFALKNQE